MMRYKIIYLVLLFVMLFVTETRGQSTFEQFDEFRGQNTFNTLSSLNSGLRGLTQTVNDIQNTLGTLSGNSSFLPDTISVEAGTNISANSVCMLLSDGKVYPFNSLRHTRPYTGFKTIRNVFRKSYYTYSSLTFSSVTCYDSFNNRFVCALNGIPGTTSGGRSSFLHIFNMDNAQFVLSQSICLNYDTSFTNSWPNSVTASKNGYFIIVNSNLIFFRKNLGSETFTTLRSDASSVSRVQNFSSGDYVLYVSLGSSSGTAILYDASGSQLSSLSLSFGSTNNLVLWTVSDTQIAGYCDGRIFVITRSGTSLSVNSTTTASGICNIFSDETSVYFYVTPLDSTTTNTYIWQNGSFNTGSSITHHRTINIVGLFFSSTSYNAGGILNGVSFATHNSYVSQPSFVTYTVWNDIHFTTNILGNNTNFCYIYPGVLILTNGSTYYLESNSYLQNISMDMVMYGRDGLVSLCYAPTGVTASQTGTFWLPGRKIPVSGLSNGIYYANTNTQTTLTTTRTPFFAGLVKDGFLYFTPSF